MLLLRANTIIIIIFIILPMTDQFQSIHLYKLYNTKLLNNSNNDPTPPPTSVPSTSQQPVSIYRILKELETHLDVYITRGTKSSIKQALKCLDEIKKEEEGEERKGEEGWSELEGG